MSPRAPKHCGYKGCLQIVYPTAKRCDEHNSGWKTSPRTESSRRTGTSRWQALRTRVLQRDNHTCQVRGPRCLGMATEVDHVVPVSRGGADNLSNTRAVCKPCHDALTAAQAREARG
jgi:5-methylcytosine-specific restriction enzyme A